MHPTQQFLYSLGALLVTYGLGNAYLRFGSNVTAKRIILPVTLCALATLIIAVLWQASLGTPQGRRLSLWPFVVLLIASLVITYRGFKFCSSCGATSYGTLFSPPQFCSKCGNKLAT
jgi:hypothetical protein